jgi:hypothetical protein
MAKDSSEVSHSSGSSLHLANEDEGWTASNQTGTKRLKGDRGLQARHIAPSSDQLAVARDEKLGYIEDNT